MERKRVAGRFVAEDKGGVAKKQATAPRAKEGSVQQETGLVQPDALDHKNALQAPKQGNKGLLGSLLERLKKSPKA